MQHIQVAALDGTHAACHLGFETDAKDIGPVRPERGIFNQQPLTGKRTVQSLDGNAIVVSTDKTAADLHVHTIGDIDPVVIFDSRTDDTHVIDGRGTAALQNHIAHGYVVAVFKIGHGSRRSF